MTVTPGPAPPTAVGDVDRLALLAALTTVVLWASAFIGIRIATPDLTAGALALARLLVGSLALGALLAFRREGLPARAAWPGIALCGLLWFGIYNVALNEGERYVDAGTAAMLVNVGPILIAVLAGVILQEGFPRPLVAGCVIAFAGAIVIGLATRGEDPTSTAGVLLCLLAAVTYAGGVIAQKPALAHATPLQVTFGACLVATIACLPFAPQLVSDAGSAGGEAIAWAIYLGLFPTALAFTTWAYALSRTTAGKLGATTYLVPPLAVVLGWVMLGEQQPALALAGGALCLAGVVVARGAGARVRGRRRSRSARSAPASRDPRSTAPAPRRS
jgi:drug/metabolite transporter (DMT)-like permease